MLYPNEYINSVKDITKELLQENNIQGIILDVDNTLIDYERRIPEGIPEWVAKMKESGIKFCILSNSNKEEKIKKVATTLDMPYLFFGKKPLKSGFKKAMKVLQLESSKIAVVGDQILTDVIGANRVKMFSILVKPIKEKDYLLTKIKRPIEKLIINQYMKTKEKNNVR